jgi:hypothetical protein
MKNKCPLVETFLFKSDLATARVDFEERINEIHKTINPIHWKKYIITNMRAKYRPSSVNVGHDGFCLFYWRE